MTYLSLEDEGRFSTQNRSKLAMMLGMGRLIQLAWSRETVWTNQIVHVIPCDSTLLKQLIQQDCNQVKPTFSLARHEFSNLYSIYKGKTAFSHFSTFENARSNNSFLSVFGDSKPALLHSGRLTDLFELTLPLSRLFSPSTTSVSSAKRLQPLPVRDPLFFSTAPVLVLLAQSSSTTIAGFFCARYIV